MLEEYRKHVAERAAMGIVAKPLDATQMAALVELLKNPPAGEEEFLLDLLINRVPPGVDEAAYVKAGFLAAIAKGETTSPLVTPEKAVELLGTMQGGYNIHPLIDALDDAKLAPIAAKALSHTLLMFDNFYDVEEKAKAGNEHAKQVMQSWADAEWFLNRPQLAEKITVTVFKVTGETNTDDLSPAPDAWSRPDIPLHALAMLKNAREGIEPDQPGVVGPIKQIEALQQKGYPLAYVGDVVGTGSSRKSATNSVLWFMGDDIPNVPNKRGGGLCLGGKIAPIFFNTMEDAGALPIEVDVSNLNMGDVIDVYPFKGEVRNHETNELLASFELKTDVLIDEVRAGGRIPLIIGRGLTTKAREALGLPHSDVFRQAKDVAESTRGFSLAQKMVGRACGVAGIRPGAYCEPKMTSVGSQDTTGPMTRDELKDLACLGFSADLVMQSFCHTAAYPKPVDVTTHHTLPDFIMNRGGVSLRPGDGVIHSWLNRMLLEADADAEYAAVIDIDLADIKEPILCAPNDPDDARLLSDVQGEKIDEVFIGSCMTNIGHFRAAGKLLDSHKGQLPTRLWVAPPTRMDAAQLTEEGYYSVFGKSGARIEIPGCSLCMGNQARVADGATVVSTSTRNFPNRLGTGANVYLASAELAAVASLLGKLPTPEEYQTFVAQVDKTAEDTYRYLNFNQLDQYTEKADGVIFQTAV